MAELETVWITKWWCRFCENYEHLPDCPYLPEFDDDNALFE